jgi:hypothetical protein
MPSRLRGRPETKWEEDVMQDMKNWRRIAMNRSEWNETVEQAGTCEGMQSLTRRRTLSVIEKCLLRKVISMITI